MSPEAVEIRDLVHDRLSAFGAFQTVKVGIVEQIEPADQLPAATVHLRRENRTPDGDANAGEPSFVHEVTFGIRITIDSGDQAELEGTLHRYANQAVRFLLSDTEFLSEIEAVTGIDEVQDYPKDGETYYAAARIDMSVSFRTTFEPFIPTSYAGANVSTRPLGKGAAAPAIKTRIPARTA